MDIATKERYDAQKKGGAHTGAILKQLIASVKPGLNLLDIEKQAREMIIAAGGIPSFETVEGYHHATCLCVNDVVVHGIPVDYVLTSGDVLTIDIGMLFDGYHTDTAWTTYVGDPSTMPADIRQFLEIGEKVFWEALEAAHVPNHIGDISSVIDRGIHGAGYSVIPSLVGHTVGKELHEKPQVPGVLTRAISKTPALVPGMSLAIEIIYSMGEPEIIHKNTDGWTLATEDHSLATVFEHTIFTTDTSYEVLTSWPK